MDVTVNVQSCEICNRSFEENDLIYIGINVYKSFSSESKVHCRRCSGRRIAPNYIFHNKKAVMILESLPQHSLPRGKYELEAVESHLTVKKLNRPVPFGTKLTLDYRSSTVYMILLPEKLQMPWKKLERILECDPVYSALKCRAEYILIDNSRNVCGFTSTPNLPVELITTDESLRNRICCIHRDALEQQYDNTDFAVSCRDAIQNLDPADLIRYCESRIQGQGTELKKAMFLIWQYLQSISRGEPFQAYNWFLTAPSGCGKTELFRTVRTYFKEHQVPVPVIQIDLSRVTEEGFKGMDPSEIVKVIVNENSHTNGYAICFLDEADKKLYPSYNSQGQDVNAQVQSNLLTMVEGCKCTVEIDDETVDFDTSKTMFIFMGAFQALRSSRQNRITAPHTLGFMTAATVPADASETFYSPISIEDMINEGLQEELAGRIQQVVNFRRMSDESMLALIQSKTREISGELGFEIRLTERAEQELLSVAFGNLGVRKPLNKIREIALNTVSARFFDDGTASQKICVIIEDMTHGFLTGQEAGGVIHYEKINDICEAC